MLHFLNDGLLLHLDLSDCAREQHAGAFGGIVLLAITIESVLREQPAEQAGGADQQVADDGPGIAPGKSQQIFQRGVRADSSPGQGIGLAVVTEIVHSYGGEIRVDDSPLGGARFHITLP